MSDLTIIDTPIEIQLKILGLLDVQSLLAIRQTCRSICQVTHERLLWLSLLEQQRKYLPLPYDLLHSEDPHLPNHPTSLLESLVIQTQRVADYWPRPRNVVSQKLERKKDDLKLMGVEIFLDRWLVVAYSGGAVYLYDIHPTPTPSSNPHDEEDHQATVVLRSCLKLNLGGIWSYVISFDSIAKKLFLALGRSVPPYFFHIYEVHLAELSSNTDMAPDAFKIIRRTTLHFNPVIGAFHTKERIVTISSSSTLELVKWDEHHIPDQNDRRYIIRLSPDGQEIIATHFMGPYILIFTAKSIELHDFVSLLRHGTSEPSTWPPLKYYFPMTFRDVSLSDCSYSRSHISETDTYTTSFFAYDMIQGLFQYVVQLTLPFEPSALPPSVQVTLMGIYPLGRFAGLTPMQTASFNSSQEQSYLMRLASRQSRNASNDSTRGFIIAHAIGPQAMRGVWIERKRSSPLREIQVWSKQALSSDLDSVSMSPEIERRVVYSVNDMKDEVKFCTFSEISGKIVLGSTMGDIRILDVQ